MFEAIHHYYLNLVPHLTTADLDALDARLSVRHIRKGDYIVKADQVCHYVSFLNKGLARLYYTFDGKDVSTGFVLPGQYTSEYESFLTQKPAVQSIDALTDLEVLDLGYNDMQQLYREYPVYQEFGRKIAEFLFIYLN